MVQSLADMTARANADMASFSDGFLGRMQAHSRTQTLLARHNWSEISVEDLLAMEFAELEDRSTRMRMAGAQASLASDAGLGLGLALHELRRNAEKFRALSDAQGVVDISWRLEDEQGFVLDWIETADPKRLRRSVPAWGCIF